MHRLKAMPSIYVTHEQDEALAMGDRIGVMRGGVLRQVGSAEDLLERPSDLTVARFVGSPPMNLLLTPDHARLIGRACREAGIRLIPLFECYGHQGWGGAPNALLRAYPQFDETPHVPLDAQWPEFYCRSWCPLHPDVNPLVFELLDELIDAFGVDAIHVGLDEVCAIADDACPRCAGKDRAELFAKVVNDLHGHLVGTRGVDMLMWADRLLDAEALGYM